MSASAEAPGDKKSIYLSEANAVEVEIVTLPSASEEDLGVSNHFLLKYEGNHSHNVIIIVIIIIKRKE